MGLSMIPVSNEEATLRVLSILELSLDDVMVTFGVFVVVVM